MHTLPVTHPAWKTYDACAQDLARKGLTGAIGDPLPNLLDGECHELIQADPEAFARRVREFAYAQAMEASNLRNDPAVDRAFPCSACKGAGSCSVCHTL